MEKHGEKRWKEEVDKCMMEMLGSKTLEDDMLGDALSDQPNIESDNIGGTVNATATSMGSVTATSTNNESEDEDEDDD